MTAAAASRSLKEKAIKRIQYPLGAGLKAWKNAMACVNLSNGQIVPGTPSPTLVRLGVFAEDLDNSASATTALVNVDFDAEVLGRWFANDGSTPVTAAMLLQKCFILDDQTVSANSAGRSPAGRVLAVDSLLGVLVMSTLEGVDEQPFALVHQARAVITSIAAYTAAAGVITANANGALAAQDGITLVAGDVVLLPTDKAAAAKDSGLYVVTSVGGAAAKFVLTRPPFFSFGSTQPTGQKVLVGGEGTAFAGSEWKSILAASTFVVDTTDPTFYPRLQFVTTAAMTAGVSAANSTLYVAPLAVVIPVPVTPGGTQGILRVSTQTSGKPTVSSIVITSSNAADTSTVKIIVENY